MIPISFFASPLTFSHHLVLTSIEHVSYLNQLCCCLWFSSELINFCFINFGFILIVTSKLSLRFFERCSMKFICTVLLKLTSKIWEFGCKLFVTNIIKIQHLTLISIRLFVVSPPCLL